MGVPGVEKKGPTNPPSFCSFGNTFKITTMMEPRVRKFFTKLKAYGRLKKELKTLARFRLYLKINQNSERERF